MGINVLTISRHRMRTDGNGVTSLVALAGCPLSCPYCINAGLLEENKFDQLTPGELVERLAIDHCYFLYTNGGVTFGGGEPLLQSEQILAFADVCPKEWNITIETSLNIPTKQLKPFLNGRFSFIIDCKAMQPEIYKNYTGRDNVQVIHNLEEVSRQLPKEKYVIKVPLIPEYSGEADVEESVQRLQEMGVPADRIHTFTYLLDKDKKARL